MSRVWVAHRRSVSGSCTVAVVDLRPEHGEDRPAIRDLHLAAFGDLRPVVADLVDGLRDAMRAQDAFSAVAEDEGEVVGHVMFTSSLLDAPRRLVDVHVLSPVAVLPVRQRQGIGSGLIRWGLQVMAERNVPVVFLEGDPGYYSRLGFKPARSRASASHPCASPTPPSRRSGSRPISRGCREPSCTRRPSGGTTRLGSEISTLESRGCL